MTAITGSHLTRDTSNTGSVPQSSAIPLPDAGGQQQRQTHVLFLVDQLTDLGGGERALMQIVRELSPRFRCSVITFRGDVNTDVERLLPVPVTVLELRKTYSFCALLRALELRRFIRSQGVDLVHTFFETSDLWGGAVARLSGVGALISSRRDMALLRLEKHQLAYQFMGKRYDRVLAVSDAVRDLVISKDGLDKDRVTTLRTGVRRPVPASETELENLRDSLEIPHSAPVILKVAHILPWKGHRDFLEAASLVRRTHPDSHFVVAGGCSDGELMKELLHRRSALGLNGCFHYLGAWQSTGPLYQMASVFCLLSSTEGLPNAVLEAMAAGCPVVATAVGGTGEAVDDGVTGFLVRPADVQTAAARICRILDSPRLAQQMSAASVRRVEQHFQLDKMMQKLEGIYDAALGRR